jgi:Ino eighty subunit 2
MTKRQRARFEDDNAHQYMKLSDGESSTCAYTCNTNPCW